MKWKKQLLEAESRTAGYDNQCSATELQLLQKSSLHLLIGGDSLYMYLFFKICRKTVDVIPSI